MAAIDLDEDVGERKVTNPKYLRQQLIAARKAAQAAEDEGIQAPAVRAFLTVKEQDLVAKLRAKESWGKVKEKDLRDLFNAPYFAGQVELKAKDEQLNKQRGSKAKNHAKLKIIVRGMGDRETTSTKDFDSISTHNNHSKTYDGYAPAFLERVNAILDRFGLPRE